MCDECFVFFNHLCSSMISVFTQENILLNCQDIFDHTREQLISSEGLWKEWYNLFVKQMDFGDSTVSLLFEIDRFLRPMINQWRKDYLEASATVKKTAHRHRNMPMMH